MNPLAISIVAGLLMAAPVCPPTTSADDSTLMGAIDDRSMTIVETAVAAGSFKTLAAALKAADLVEPLEGKGPFTVFAPTDEAFRKLPAGTLEKLLMPENKPMLQSILKYHVVKGNMMAADVLKNPTLTSLNGQRIDIAMKDGKAMADKAVITKTDIACSNGVIHVIDSVILPADKDIVDTAVAAGSFKTLAAALESASLIATLQGEGPFTVFAPTDEAFRKLPPGTVENLLKPENRDQLVKILTAHVVSGRVYASDVMKMASAKTLQGYAPSVKTTDQGVMIDNAKVVKADIEATNGVIHVIDTVLMPR